MRKWFIKLLIRILLLKGYHLHGNPTSREKKLKAILKGGVIEIHSGPMPPSADSPDDWQEANDIPAEDAVNFSGEKIFKKDELKKKRR